LIKDIENPNIGYRVKISQQNWSQFYEVTEETITFNKLTPRCQAVKMNTFCDAAHATDLITHRYYHKEVHHRYHILPV